MKQNAVPAGRHIVLQMSELGHPSAFSGNPV
jgi:hypothetical protein